MAGHANFDLINPGCLRHVYKFQYLSAKQHFSISLCVHSCSCFANYKFFHLQNHRQNKKILWYFLNFLYKNGICKKKKLNEDNVHPIYIKDSVEIME